MALYELGNSYLQAWGPKSADPKLAMAYYRSAAMLGDRDAQEQLGFLLSTGRQGVKKDLKEAAKWYRAAVKQDASSVGLSWIYKVSRSCSTEIAKKNSSCYGAVPGNYAGRDSVLG